MNIKDVILEAIPARTVLMLGYSRASDGVITLHHVAPIDVRPGETERTSGVRYLWAYCYEESRLEMHILDRIRSAKPTDVTFEPSEILARWPQSKWPFPDAWYVPRNWI